MSGQPDPKQGPRVRDAGLIRSLYLRGGTCALCGNTASLHHLLKRSQGGDDLLANLIWLCGDGTTGHHGLIENEDVTTRLELGAFVGAERPDFVAYIQRKLGETEGKEWLARRLYLKLT